MELIEEDLHSKIDDLFISIDQKLVSFNFNKYSIKSFKKLDELYKSKILDYSIEISWKNISLEY